MPSVRLKSADIHYRMWGSGPPLIFAHGAGGNHMSWWQQIPAFSDRYTCIAFDHPGFGKSNWGDDVPGDITYGDVMIELLEALKIEMCGFVAQSMGGWSALGLITRQPERVASLVLASTFCGVVNSKIDAALAARDAELVRQRDEWRARRLGSFNPALGKTAAEESQELHTLYDMISAHNPPRETSGTPGNQAIPSRPRWGVHSDSDLLSISAPTLLISGEEDIVAPSETMEELDRIIPDSQLTQVKGTGHSPYFHKADQFNYLVREHLEKTYSG